MSVKGGLPDGSRGRGRPQENQVIPLLQFTHNIKAIKVDIFSFRMSSENNHFSREDGDFERKYKAGPLITFLPEAFRFVLAFVLTVVS